MPNESDFQLQNSALAIEFARDSVKSAIVVNGGAAVAILAFMSAEASATRYNVEMLQSGLGYFALGVVLAMATSIIGYFAQTAFAKMNARRIAGKPASGFWAEVLTAAGAFLIVASAGVFLIGLHTTQGALLTPPPA